jgi:hypothetical protein
MALFFDFFDDLGEVFEEFEYFLVGGDDSL